METKTYIQAMKKYARGYTVRDVLSTDSNGANFICQNHGSTYIITIILIDKRKGLSTAIDSLSYDLPIQYKYRLPNEIDINSIAFIEDFETKNEICYIRKLQETKLIEFAAQTTRAVQKNPVNRTGWIPPYTPSSPTTTPTSSPQHHKPLVHIPVWLAAILVIFIGIGIYYFLIPQSIDAIYVKNEPQKTSYYVGETLDVSGLTLLLEYNNKMSKTVTEDIICSPTVLSNAGTQKITVSYDDMTTSFNVTVSAVEVDFLSVQSNPSDTSYFVGEMLDTGGLMLMAKYNNGESKTITSGFTCSPTKLSTKGTQKITVTYGGKSTLFNVNVTALELTSIVVKSNPSDTSYFVGETLNTNGLALTATYNNGEIKTISSGFTCSPTKLSTAGTQKITVTYEGKSTTFDVNVTAVELTSVSVKSNPSDTSYYVGETLNTSGFTLTATYNNGETKTVSSGFTCSPTQLSAAGNQKITVSYGGKTTVFNVNVAAVELSSISIKTNPSDTSYYVGETLNTSGLTLTAKYNNGETKTVSSGFTCSPTQLSAAGSQKITVSYGGKTTVFNVNVAAVELSSISVKTNPSDTSYYVGETLNTSGLTLTAKYNNGETKTISNGFTCSPTKLSSTGTQKITVTYEGKSTTFNVSVDHEVIEEVVEEAVWVPVREQESINKEFSTNDCFSVTPYTTADTSNICLNLTSNMTGYVYYYFTNSNVVPSAEDFNSFYNSAVFSGMFYIPKNEYKTEKLYRLSAVEKYDYIIIQFRTDTQKHVPIAIANSIAIEEELATNDGKSPSFERYERIVNGNISDISSTKWDWARTYIEEAAANKDLYGWKLENGTYAFHPDDPITRAEYIQMLNDMFDITATVNINYDDVSKDAWYYEHFSKAAADGYLLNYGKNVVPNGYMTREEAMALLIRVMKIELTDPKQYITPFVDWKDLNPAFEDYVRTALMEGIMNGLDATHYKPKDTMNRAIALVAITRALNSMKE